MRYRGFKIVSRKEWLADGQTVPKALEARPPMVRPIRVPAPKGAVRHFTFEYVWLPVTSQPLHQTLSDLHTLIDQQYHQLEEAGGSPEAIDPDAKMEK